MKLRRKGVLAAGLAVLAAGATVTGASAGGAGGAAGGSSVAGGRPEGSARDALQVFYSPPVLVRAGEAVRIPVDASCATEAGGSCPVSVTFSTPDVGGAWRSFSNAATPGLAFDLSASASAAVAVRASGFVPFRIAASDAWSVRAKLPPGPADASLGFYVTRAMPRVLAPAISFGDVVRPSRTVLSLPWGSGERKAGLELGDQSGMIGPRAFDVDGRGRIYVLDALQRRLAVFAKGRLVRQTAIGVTGDSDLAVAPDGTAFVLKHAGPSLQVLRIDPSGRMVGAVDLGPGILSQITTAAGRAYVFAVPLDRWIGVPVASRASSALISTVERPTADGGSLLRVVRDDRLRIATVADGQVHGALEIGTLAHFGEIALSEPDGGGGYWVVMHVWRENPTRADQYEVMHLVHGKVVRAFAVANQAFAETAPLSRFRLGPDGGVYQLVSDPHGMRIVEFRSGE